MEGKKPDDGAPREPQDGSGVRYDDYATDPLPDTDNLVLPAWRILRDRGECSDAVISSMCLPTSRSEEERVMRGRVREALKFLEEQGYVVGAAGTWKLSEEGVTASEQEVADLWPTTFVISLDERADEVAAFAAAYGFSFTHEAPSWITDTDLPVRWLNARTVHCTNFVGGTWGDTVFAEFDARGVTPALSGGSAAASFVESCAVTGIDEADFPRVAILAPSERLDRLQLRTQRRSTHPLPAVLRPLEDWARRIRPKHWQFRDALLHPEMVDWLVGPGGPIRALGRDRPVGLTVGGPWIVCDTPLLAVPRLGRLLEVLDGFRARIPTPLSGPG